MMNDEKNGMSKQVTFDLPVLNGEEKSSPFNTHHSSLSKREYWQSLDELADSPEFDAYVKREYPSQMEVLIDPVSRRSFMKLMGASLGLAGLAACTVQPKEDILPYIRQPEEIVPGEPLYFATAMPRSGGAVGLLVRSNEGRPTKVEGNPDHPASLGATDIFAQAAILQLYDPDRSQSINHLGDISSWGDFITAMTGQASLMQSKKGEGFRLLTESTTSASFTAMMQSFLADNPQAKWHQFEPGRGNGQFSAIGNSNVQYRFDKADRILALDSDFMMSAAAGGASVRYARDWAEKRKVSSSSTDMSRLYVAETSISPTGANADNRLGVRPSQFEGFVGALAAAMQVGSGGAAGQLSPRQQEFVDAVARDLLAMKGRSIVIAGEWQSPYVHSLVHQMNAALGNVGQTVFYSAPVEASPVDHVASITELAQDMAAGKVDSLIILGGVNPVYSAPADLKFAEAMKKVSFIVHHGLYHDETAVLAHWHVPAAHSLESWDDAKAHDGTASIVQPLIAPLYQGKTAQEVLTTFTKNPSLSAYEIVKNYWTGGAKGGDIEKTWRRALNDGIIQNTNASSGAVGAAAPATPQNSTPSLQAAQGFDIVFRPDLTISDGRYANNGWLQELPKPISTLTWDNAALVSKATAEKLKLHSTLQFEGGHYDADVIHIEVNGLGVNAPVWIAPGQPDDTITLYLGYGRTRAGRVGNGLGFNAGQIRTTKNYWFATGAKVSKKDQTYPLAGTQVHFLMEDRDPVRAINFSDYKKDLNYVHEKDGHNWLEEPSKDNSFFPHYDYKGYAWGMTIDLNSCIGCNACMAACVAENNIPVVGKEQVLRSREMHWIRVDRYYTGAAEDPETYFQPVPCQQCEEAPCELVCPVDATTHSAEGLNDMTYNRCVGTRYCSNNCPYKVRRFNFLLFQDWTTPQFKMARNPDVSVRSRGVMEKCTYCVQRIQEAKIHAEKENRRVRDGDIVTACEAACPTDAIVFGDINDPTSRVARLKTDSRNYALLGDLNTHPRTTYLGVVRNPNPEIKRIIDPRLNKEAEIL
jgi:MoCo/4Fe-4S cofactor protein with predicted Tat translocation signal